jgi:plasmid stabilization system protein ParE
VLCTDIVNWPESEMKEWVRQIRAPVALLAAGPPAPRSRSRVFGARTSLRGSLTLLVPEASVRCLRRSARRARSRF